MEDTYDVKDLKEFTKAMRQGKIIMDREGTYWTECERKQLVESFNHGDNISEIARNLHRTEIGIMEQIVCLHLCVSTKKRRRKAPKCLCDRCKVKCDKCSKT